MRLLSADADQELIDALFAETGGLCEQKIPMLPLGWLMNCDDKATAQYRAGCVHEHVVTGRFCPDHGLDLLDGRAGCARCLAAGHECQMNLIVVEELP